LNRNVALSALRLDALAAVGEDIAMQSHCL